MPTETQNRWKVAGICLGLAALVFLVFGQTAHFGFINFDDGEYVFENPFVSKGLSLSGIGWAFTHLVSAHWHPLTVIFMMLDCQLYGLAPGGHHLTNVILHAACVVLLFLMLLEMTGALWRCAFVAAVFAIHPLRVESVAWVSELKDVLSGVFFMLTLWAYARYAKSRGHYAMVLVWFALGLMSKPMLVTVPCVLLLLDYWPLGRLTTPSNLPGLLKEKIPLFVLSAVSCVTTIFAVDNGSGNAPVTSYPANAPIAYAVYLLKLVYPTHLALLYPIPKGGPPVWEVLDACLILAALTAGVWYLHRTRQYLVVGWLWYLGMLVPVTGIMQTGGQAYADRYTYLPQIGICLGATWLAADWAAQKRSRRVALGGFGAAILCALAIVAWHQTTYWRDSVILWNHTLETTEDNYLAHDSLGDALFRHGRDAEAIAEFRKAMELEPRDADAYNNLGNALFQQKETEKAVADYRTAVQLNSGSAEPHYNLANALLEQGHTEEAIAEYRQALRINPYEAKFHYNLGNALLRQGRLDEAVNEFHAVLQIDPNRADAHNNLAKVLFQQGRLDEAIAECREALRINPNDATTHNNLGDALIEQGHAEEAIAECREAVRLDPTYADAHNNLGNALFQQGQTDAAIAEYRAALQINPALVITRNNLGNALLKQGRMAEAGEEFQKVLEVQPDYVIAQNNLAWILATAPQQSPGDGAKALELAAKANKSTGGNNPLVLRTLAAAYAGAGDFSDAIQTANNALQLAQGQSNGAVADALRKEITLYQAGHRVENGQ